MKILRYQIFIISIILFSSYTFESSSHSVKIIGKWYHVSGGNYYKTSERSDISRWYEFNANSKVKYSTCTDWCGCMRQTMIGNYKWENDSILSVHFTKIERKEVIGSTDLEKPISKRLVIKQINNTGLRIAELKVSN